MRTVSVPTLSAHAVQRLITTGQTRTEVLQCCDLELRGTGLTAVVGHSGSGKSSFLMCLSGLDKPTSGTVVLNGRDIYRQSRAQRARMLRQEIGFVFQQYNLVPFLSVEENISLPFQLNHVAIPRDAIGQLIDAFGLGRRRKAPARTLSGGEQQRTALCRALALRPSIVFADEPTGALDSRSSRAVLEVLRGYPGADRSVVMVTHDIAAACMADVVLVMRDGLIRRRLTSPAPGDVLAAAEEAGRNA